nr:MAG TPA: hypothetical protein [Caudoviricetes sp.]
MVQVQNMLSKKGNKVANQFEIFGNGYIVFQSYSTVIAVIKNRTLYVDKAYYSRTTSKYLNIFKDDHSAAYDTIVELDNAELNSIVG